MRAISSAMQAHLAGTSHSRTWMVRLDLADGTVLGLTTFRRNKTFDLGDGAGPVEYLAGVAEVSDVDLVLGLDSSNFELTGPFGDVITLAAVAGGRFSRAEVRLFQINWREPAAGAIEILFGHVTQARPEAATFVLEVRNEADKFNQVVGETLTPQCKADFGDANCGVTPESITGIVTAVTDDLIFTVSFAGTYAADYFNFGKVSWLTGALAGTRPMEIFDWTDSGQVTLFMPLVAMPSIGDTCTISRGCSKVRRHDDPTVPTCMTYDNVVNMWKAYPDLPGTDQIVRPTLAGQGNG
jgi:uncharacterized phage protein (TIGR02218 family)